MIKNIYFLEWYGPFPNPQEIVKWEKKNIGNGKTYLYLFKGKKYARRKYSYYCGQAFEQTAGERMMNNGHHINEVIGRPKDLSIWVAKCQNKRPNKTDVNLVEKLITSVLAQVIIADEKSYSGEKTLLEIIKTKVKDSFDDFNIANDAGLNIEVLLLVFPVQNIGKIRSEFLGVRTKR